MTIASRWALSGASALAVLALLAACARPTGQPVQGDQAAARNTLTFNCPQPGSGAKDQDPACACLDEVIGRSITPEEMTRIRAHLSVSGPPSKERSAALRTFARAFPAAFQECRARR